MQDKLLLPSVIYGATGIEMNLYFANVFSCINPKNYFFKFHCDIGRCDQERWRCIPTAENIGSHEAEIEVFNDNGMVASGKCSVVISAADSAAGKVLRLLMIGDSLTDQTCYPADLHRLCVSNKIDLTMLGTNVPLKFREFPSGKMINYPPEKELEGVRHEGWGGWSAGTFLYRDKPIENDVYYHWNNASPFINEEGVFDFKGYINRNCDGIAPDVILLALGGNDMITVNPDNQQKVIGRFLENIQKLYQLLRKDAPETHFGIVLEPYGSMDQSSWGKSHGCQFFAWDRRSLVPAAYAEMVKIFSDEKNCSIVPLYTAVDPINGYHRSVERCFEGSPRTVERGTDSLHPSPAGYRQVANSAFGWLLNTMERFQK